MKVSIFVVSGTVYIPIFSSNLFTAGSKVPYAGQISADLDFITTLYPNAVANMRSRMKSLGHKEWNHLPLWMKTIQSSGKAPLGFVLAVPICYCKPGTSALLRKRISDKGLIFRNIDFIIEIHEFCFKIMFSD